MKKLIALLLCLMLLSLLTVPALAAPAAPVITMQPQSHYYPEYSVALYTVKASGSNLRATWYIRYQGKTYTVSSGGSMQPWEAYAGEGYGPKKLDGSTFQFAFEGIEAELDGAEIWCQLEDGHHQVTSQPAYICVGDYGSPPEILDIPAQITVQKDQDAEIRCLAKSTDGAQLNFLWYETSTGKLPDIKAMTGGAETGDYIFCDTRTAGTRYYVCGITTDRGGRAYSSVVAVTVEEKAPETTPPATVPAPTEAPTQAPTEAPTETPATEPSQPETAPEPAPTPSEAPPESPEGFPWWALVLVGLGAAGAGVATAILLLKKR